MLIRKIVQQALTTRYLTREAEDQLRQLLRGKYDSQDLRAFMQLQNAVMEGQVQQECRSCPDNLLIFRDREQTKNLSKHRGSIPARIEPFTLIP